MPGRRHHAARQLIASSTRRSPARRSRARDYGQQRTWSRCSCTSRAGRTDSAGERRERGVVEAQRHAVAEPAPVERCIRETGTPPARPRASTGRAGSLPAAGGVRWGEGGVVGGAMSTRAHADRASMWRRVRVPLNRFCLPVLRAFGPPVSALILCTGLGDRGTRMGGDLPGRSGVRRLLPDRRPAALAAMGRQCAAVGTRFGSQRALLLSGRRDRIGVHGGQ